MSSRLRRAPHFISRFKRDAPLAPVVGMKMVELHGQLVPVKVLAPAPERFEQRQDFSHVHGNADLNGGRVRKPGAER